MTELLPADSSNPVFLRCEALGAGYSDREIARLVKGGQWHRLRHGAYVPAEVWTGASERHRHALLARAVLKQARTDAVLSHVSAIAEYDGPKWGLRLDVVHVTRTDKKAGRREAGVCQHQGVLLPADVTTRNGLFVTSPARTAIDITTVASTEAGLVAVNHLLHAALTTKQAISERYDSMVHHPHTLRTDLVLRLADSRIESVAESRTVFLCWRQHLPSPEPQWLVTDERGRELARLDFAWPAYGVWLEFDGREKYVKYLREGETVTDVVLREKRREEMIRELTGWRCIRITWADLAYPERTAARIRAVLEAAAPRVP